MKSRVFLVSLLVFFATLAQGFADLRIRRAYYGRPENNRDVKAYIENYVKNGIYSFRVAAASLGSNPNPGQADFLRVEYEVDGRRYTTDAQEAQIFTFAGVNNPRPPSRLLGLPIPAPYVSTATVQITNATTGPLYAYNIDRYGRWNWQAQIGVGRTTTDVGVIGQRWAVSTPSGVVVKEFTVAARDNQLIIGAPLEVFTTLRIENNSRNPLAVYSLNYWKTWVWQGALAPGASYETSAKTGETWVVATVQGRIVQQFGITRGMPPMRIAR